MIFLRVQQLRGLFASSYISAMTVKLTAEQEKFIRSNVAELREKIATSMEQIRRGEVVDGKEVFRNLRKKLQSR